MVYRFISVCAHRVCACAGAAESLHTYIHTGEWSRDCKRVQHVNVFELCDGACCPVGELVDSVSRSTGKRPNSAVELGRAYAIEPSCRCVIYVYIYIYIYTYIHIHRRAHEACLAFGKRMRRSYRRTGRNLIKPRLKKGLTRLSITCPLIRTPFLTSYK